MISGFIGGAISAFLCNIVAGRIGGIEVDLVGGLPAFASAPPVVPLAPPAATPTNIKFCVVCGAKMPASAKFCVGCGAAQP